MKIQKSLLITLLACVGYSTITKAQIINTIAGTGVSGYSGDGAAATIATLNNPAAVAVDAAGNIYIADASNNSIRKVNTSGIISTLAGTGVAGYSGDGAAATLATLNGPIGVAVDAVGNVYIADEYNHRIRKINTGGVISTFAGTGVLGYSGDGSAATISTLYFPIGVAVDAAGNVYIADYGNDRIRKVNTGGVISTIAGNGLGGYSGDGAAATLAQLSGPTGVAVDPTGNVYIADYVNHRIRKVNAGGVISTLAGTGVAGYSGDGAAATLAQLNYPFGVAEDAAGNVYISDKYNHCIRKVNTGGIISTFAGTGVAGYSGDGAAATLAQLNYPFGVAEDAAGNVYIADLSNNSIRKVSCSGPTVTATSSNTLLCPTQSATLTGSGAATYTWSTGATTTVIAVSPSVTTSYTVVGTNTVGCSATAVVTQSVSTCTGIETHFAAAAVNVYPNPGAGLYTLEVESATKIQVYDMLGSIILFTTIESGKFKLNISEQAKGLYILKATSNGKTANVRLIKD
ncbi:MAG: T9SS type A sorting domain-containing protein [Bacteroidetes bacterium]|nr:T9SS type A sorting domain-containing protein [Bacteroidota bacterium]